MSNLCEVSALQQKRYDATVRFLVDLFSSEDEAEDEATSRAIAPQSGYLGIAEVNAVPTYSQAASCSIFRVGERKTQTFTILGLILMLFGSCGTVAVGAKETTPTVRPAYKDDPFTTMNGYGDRVY
ncbi:MAG: hypothetical protein WC683_08400 [bacterium]